MHNIFIYYCMFEDATQKTTLKILALAKLKVLKASFLRSLRYDAVTPDKWLSTFRMFAVRLSTRVKRLQQVPIPACVYCHYVSLLGTAVAQWLRCCAINRKVAGSIPEGVTGIFH